MKQYQIWIFLVIIFSNTVFAQKNAATGDQINSNLFNSSTLSIGSIQQSILTLSQFQTLNGDCWVLMTGQSISGSDLASLGISILPDATGRFLRSAGGNAAALAQPQEDEFKSHTHVQSAHGHDLLGAGGGIESLTSSATRGVMGANSGGTYDLTAGTGNRYIEQTAAINQNSGGVETRPKNLTVNMFIKINKQCNFN